ncbi:hypothetical protein DND132_0965 [Pseudodesulfovibrio mercurii]|uniref:Uncharacterized protein n=1 Tax=Pseudodesulfovibrio mercurii TaxID=641491 RepID=F0JIC6_9BACT|nr:hypothetical protein [Pseudodesulfovibrio mercurii]EGB14178.1 hypothetical protein DND132_0965 [Pseudodesulfovibrio mercurii]
MITGKTAVLIFTTLSDEALKNSDNSDIGKLFRKGSAVPLKAENDLRTEALAGSTMGESIVETAKAAGYKTDELGSDTDLYVTEAETEEQLASILSVAYTVGVSNTLIILASPTLAIFYGLGIQRKVQLKEPLNATCIAPTISWIADIPYPADVEAAPAYPVLKGLNFKAGEMAKLKKSLDALTLNIERGNLKPWDKHDCA